MPTKTTLPGRILRGMLLALTGLLAIASNAIALNHPIQNTSISWALSEGRVLEVGETVILPNGTMSSGYTLEATAESSDESLLAKGTLRLQLTAFTPKKDSKLQKAGTWYVRGSWSLIDVDAPEVINPRYTPGAFGGQLQVELPFNPAEGDGDWTAKLRLPQTTLEPLVAEQGRQPMRGNGELYLNQNLDGVMTLDLKLWPRI